MGTSVTVALLNDGQTAISTSTQGTAVANGGPISVGGITDEGLVICNCSAVNTSGIFDIKIQGSADGGTTWVDLVNLGNISAVGMTVAKIASVAPLLRWKSAKVSGTSVTVQVMVVGLVPQDSVNETPVPSTTNVGTLLAMKVQPATAVESATITPSVKVNVEDYLGNVVTIDSATVVTVAILGGTPGGVTFAGTKTQTASSGVATFDDLSIDTAAAYSLIFTAPGLTSVTSAPCIITVAP